MKPSPIPNAPRFFQGGRYHRLTRLVVSVDAIYPMGIRSHPDDSDKDQVYMFIVVASPATRGKSDTEDTQVSDGMRLRCVARILDAHEIATRLVRDHPLL